MAEKEKSMMELVLENKQRYIPKQGYNLVGVDTFEHPGEELFLISHHDDPMEAKTAQQAFQQANPDTPAYIYAAEGESQEQGQVQKAEKFYDFTAPIVAKEDAAYEKVKRALMKRGYNEHDFEPGGDLYGQSTNELLDLILED